jgi:HD-GYP domain-containing protein (c-di-GMP phosphodiesterase class II)
MRILESMPVTLKLVQSLVIAILLLATSIAVFVTGAPSYLGIAPLLGFLFISLHKSGGAPANNATLFQSSIDGLQKRLNKQDDFFRLVNENTLSSLAIYTDRDEFWFVNARAAEEMGVDENEAIGKKPVEILASRGRKIGKTLEQVRTTGKPIEVCEQYNDAKGSVRYTQTRYCTLAPFGDFPGGVMARGENVTGLLIERERQEGMLRQVISTLVAVVDRRDPYASGHSSRTGQLARLLAIEMQLSDQDVETTSIAGSLMNFGKVLISRSVLTKTEALTKDELQRIRDSILTSADILSRIDFGLPVVATLRQVLERYDGSGGPEGLKGDQILIFARIVAVANSFIALVSPRAYRDGIDPAVAAQKIAEDAGKSFDPRVTAALQGFIIKNIDRLDWLAITKNA